VNIFGEERYTVENGGVNLINRLRRFGLKNVVISDDGFLFSTAFKNKAEVSRLLGKRVKKLHEKRGVFAVLDVFLGRICVPICVICCVLLFAFTESFAFRVRISGVTGEEYLQVQEFLSSRNIGGITKKSALENVDLANELVKNFPFVAHANIKIVGSTAVVFVMRAENFVPSTAEIVSTADGVIWDIVVFSGEQKVFNGMVVHVGDVLVTGNRPMAIIKIANGTEIIAEINNTLCKTVISS